MAIDYQGPEGSVRYDAPSGDEQATQAQVAQWMQAAAAAAQQPMYGDGTPAPGTPAPGAYPTMYVAPNPYAQTQFQTAPAPAVFNGPQPATQAEPPQAFQQPQAGPFAGAYANMSPGTQASQMAWAQQAGQPAMQQVAVYAPKSKATAGVLGLVLGALGAHVLLREEGPLQVDALDMGAGKLGTALLVGLGNGGAGRTNVLWALRERSGQPARGSATGQLGA